MAKNKKIENKPSTMYIKQRFYVAPDTGPTYRFNVGDVVDIGCLKDPVVVEVLNDGREYITESIENTAHSHEPANLVPVRKHWMWYDVRPKTSPHDGRISEDTSRYNLSYSNTSLEDILGKYLNFGIDMDPEYQRDYVWDQSDKEALIGSILADLDIGRFVFRKMPYAGNAPAYQVVDGKQRIRAIVDFYLNKFEYKGKRYNELCNADRRVFKDKGIIAATIQESVPLQTVIEIFVRLNVSGRVMSSEHIEAVKAKYLKGEK